MKSFPRLGWHLADQPADHGSKVSKLCDAHIHQVEPRQQAAQPAGNTWSSQGRKEHTLYIIYQLYIYTYINGTYIYNIFIISNTLCYDILSITFYILYQLILYLISTYIISYVHPYVPYKLLADTQLLGQLYNARDARPGNLVLNTCLTWCHMAAGQWMFILHSN